ncbi:MAG: tRNA pseudouridine(38-40) synthase TruA [Bacteroidia bacterium]
MARYFISIRYKGSNYNGWQIQENTPNTVQQVLEEKLSMLLQETIEVIGCGRTDTGVHARKYFAHFNSKTQDLLSNKAHWIYKFNSVLPNDISVDDIRKVKAEAHARFDAVSRTYHYHLHQKKDPFIESLSWYQFGEIDFELMNKAAELLLHTSDFTSFSKVNTQTKTNICNVTAAKWTRLYSGEWRFSITADRFLRNMVRAIVGTLIMVGRNKLTLAEFKKIIEDKSRNKAGMSAPAQGLFLVDVVYPETVFDD